MMSAYPVSPNEYLAGPISSRTSSQIQAGALPTDPLEEILGAFPCVKLRGLPFEATVGDILLFFSGLPILDIIFFVRDYKTTGDAVVLFSTMEGCEMALQCDHQYMGRRYVEVFQAKRGEYYLAASLRLKSEQLTTAAVPSIPTHRFFDTQIPPFHQFQRPVSAMEHTGVIKMRGLPFRVTPEDIAYFFRGKFA